MSVQNLIELPSVSNVGAGNTATIEIPVGAHTIDKVFIEHSVGGVDKIGRIEALINGKVFQTFDSATELRAINSHYGRPQANNMVCLHFDRPELRQLNDAKSFGIGTANVQTFHIRVQLDATATNPSLKATAMVSAPRELGAIAIIRKFHKSNPQAGLVEIDNLPKGARILAVHLEKADISHCEVKVNNSTYFESSKQLNNLVLAQARPVARAPMTGFFSIDFTTQGTPAGALITKGVQDLRIKPTIDTAGSTDMIVEYWGLLGSA